MEACKANHGVVYFFAHAEDHDHFCKAPDSLYFHVYGTDGTLLLIGGDANNPTNVVPVSISSGDLAIGTNCCDTASQGGHGCGGGHGKGPGQGGDDQGSGDDKGSGFGNDKGGGNGGGNCKPGNGGGHNGDDQGAGDDKGSGRGNDKGSGGNGGSENGGSGCSAHGW